MQNRQIPEAHHVGPPPPLAKQAWRRFRFLADCSDILAGFVGRSHLSSGHTPEAWPHNLISLQF